MKKLQKQAILFTSQSGVGSKTILDKLSAKLGKGVEVVSADGEGIGNLVRTASVSNLLLEHIQTLYSKSIQKIDSTAKGLVLIRCHPCFWKKGTCFSTVGWLLAEIIKNVNIKSVITFIDDFFNVYLRIRAHYKESNITDSPNPLDLLYWRNVDLMLAHMIANQLRVSHHIIAVGHSFDSLVTLLAHRHVTLYAGHPITEIRQLEKTASARAMAKINADFLNPLSAKPRFVTFIPDTIDEMPICNLPPDYESLLQSRWPEGWLQGKEPLTPRPAVENVNQFFGDLMASVKSNPAIYREVIYGQIADRDYRLVNQAKNFVFVLTKDFPNSEGVEKELTQARYSFNNTYFFNPDELVRTRRQGPAWASNLTGENSNLEKLLLPLKDESPIASNVSARR